MMIIPQSTRKAICATQRTRMFPRCSSQLLAHRDPCLMPFEALALSHSLLINHSQTHHHCTTHIMVLCIMALRGAQAPPLAPFAIPILPRRRRKEAK